MQNNPVATDAQGSGDVQRVSLDVFTITVLPILGSLQVAQLGFFSVFSSEVEFFALSLRER